MTFRSFLIVGFFSMLFSVSCTSEKAAECITSLDCENGLVCEEGVCVENTGKTDVDNITQNDSNNGIPDNNNELPDNNQPVDNEQKDETEEPDDVDDVVVVDEIGDLDEIDVDGEMDDKDDKDEVEDDEPDNLVIDEEPDEDIVETTPCNPNPCTEISMSDGECTIQGIQFSCGCNEGYYWNQTECKDMNECLDGLLNDCHEFADCENTTGSYTCECHENYSGDGTDCVADTQNVDCTNVKPENSVWNVANTDGKIDQTWNGTVWAPASDTCLWDCEEHYSKSGDLCEPETITFNCADKPVNGTEWNTVSSYERTWNGTEFEPAETDTAYGETPSTTACLYKCAENYSWDGTECVAQIKIYECYTKPLIGTKWNTVSSYEQTWDGTKWIPESTTTEYNETESTTACRFICEENYSWNGSMCAADTRIFDCAAKPADRTQWNKVSNYEQTWDGSGWMPADSVTEYNETSSTTACRFVCEENYTWNGTICEADTKTFNCADKPEAGTDWNTVASYDQTWSGTDWLPADSTTEYNETSSETMCRFICAMNYSWDGSACVADTKTFTCADKPAVGTDWNTVASYQQTWSGTEWLPADSTTEHNTTASTQACRFTCIENYTWNGAACVGSTRTYECPEKPGIGTEWNTVANYEQTWSGSDWLPAGTGTEYNTTSDTTSCRYKCITNFSWNGTECEGTTQEDQACTGLPANASWNTASQIDQSWNGSAWVPSTAGVHNTTASTSECRFKCVSYYNWDGSSCNYCNTDAHCGSNCLSCSGDTPKCTASTPHCVECLTDDDCEENYTCNGSNACEITFYCGDGIVRYDDHSIDANILVQLHMDENTGATTADTSGNSRTTSLSGTTWITAGKYENALVFNGTTSFATIGGGYSPPTNNFTMEAWVKVVGTHEIDAESTSGTAGTSGQKELFGANHGSENAGAGISVGTNGISVYEHGDGYMPALAVYSGYIGTGWNHIAVTYTNKQPRIYLNGILVRTGLTSPRGTVYAPTMVGKGSYGLFNGTIDEVRIYNTALTAAQIRSHFYCDDGDNANGDGCDATCHVEENYTCSGEPSSCTDNVALCTQKLAEFNYDFSSAQGWSSIGSDPYDEWTIDSGLLYTDPWNNNMNIASTSPTHDLSACSGQDVRVHFRAANALEEDYDKLFIEVPGAWAQIPWASWTEYTVDLPEESKTSNFTTTFRVTTDGSTSEDDAGIDWIILERP